MAKRLLVDHHAVSAKLEKQFRNHCKQWLAGEGQWPLSIPLGIPTESQAAQDLMAVQTWQAQWQDWNGPAEMQWLERRWPSLGKQRLPERLLIHCADDVADWVGEGARWQRAKQRYHHWCDSWPPLATLLSRRFNLLADYDEQDFLRLESVLTWLLKHPDSGLYIRQLPITGIESKWLEKRRGLIAELLSAIRGSDNDSKTDFYTLTGIRREPVVIRIRILDPQLRRQFGGLYDITAPVAEWANRPLQVRRVYIVENLQTGLAFTDIEGAVVVMGLGYSVNLLAGVPWLLAARCFYWGDLDSDGFAILSRARNHIPDVESLLMDEETLMRHQPLWGEDRKTTTTTALDCLTFDEQQLYLKLKSGSLKLRNGSLGHAIRLEQERIAWDYAWQRIVQR